MKHKILSFLTAFAMVFGIIAAPFVNASAEEQKYENSTNKINIHKILFKKEADYNAWDSSKHKTSYIKDDQLAAYFENKAEEIAGVAYD
ncbi:MAG: cell wall anchor protein, partial [Anaerococcus sp.]|nr:cell wall anchor protein [Anaerococcus sp.]